ncbi:hypothetical protein ABIF79_010039 [Bradyrhizobium japonicum]
MNALLCRVGADTSPGGGGWNGPVNGVTRKFVYVPIPESRSVHPGLERPYASLNASLSAFGVELPGHLRLQQMHLDPDFDHLTYGDVGERAKQLKANLSRGDVLVFYAGLRDTLQPGPLVYAIIGVFVVDEFVLAINISPEARHQNAHSRRVIDANNLDLVVRGRPLVSGRLDRCLPIGEFKDRAYRVRPDLIEAWGGLSVKDGYLQRSARLPRFLNPERFCNWLKEQHPVLVQANN